MVPQYGRYLDQTSYILLNIKPFWIWFYMTFLPLYPVLTLLSHLFWMQFLCWDQCCLLGLQ